MKKLFVCALAVAMVFAFTAPTMAADWNFYGSARFATFSNDVDPQVAGVESDADTNWSVQGNSRIGATVSAGDVGGGFEYGSGPNLRKLYGTWNFGAGTLLVGQTYTPIAEFYSNQVWGSDEDLLGNGMAYHGRKGQIRLTFGGFDVAFVTPVTQATLFNTAGGTTTAADNDVTLPQIVMSYKFATDMFSIKPYLLWATYDFNTGVTAATQTESVDSLVYGIGGKVNLGPAYIAANVWAGTNAGNAGMYMATDGNAVVDATGKIIDNDTLAYAAVVGFKASDMWSFELGYGASSSEVDTAGVKVEDTSFSYYINTSITMAPGVFIVPEFGVYSLDEVTVTGAPAVKQDETTYFGAKWQINF